MLFVDSDGIRCSLGVFIIFGIFIIGIVLWVKVRYLFVVVDDVLSVFPVASLSEFVAFFSSMPRRPASYLLADKAFPVLVPFLGSPMEQYFPGQVLVVVTAKRGLFP